MPECSNWSEWLRKTRFAYMTDEQVAQTLNYLNAVKDRIIFLADIKEGYRIADFGCGSGLVGFGILEKFQDKVELIFSDKFEDCIEECKKILSNYQIANNVKFLQSDIRDIKLENDYLDCALTRSVLVHVKDKMSAFSEFYRVLKHGGCYCAFEPIISENTRYYELTLPSQISDYFEFKKAEKEFMENPDDPLVNFSAQSLDKDLSEAGFSDVVVNVNIATSKYAPDEKTIQSWFTTPPAPDQKTVKERFLDYFEEKKVDNYILEISHTLNNKEIKIDTKTALIKAVK